MSTAGDIREGFRAALASVVADVPGFTAYRVPPSKPEVPCAFASTWAVDYESENAVLAGAGEWTWTLIGLASRADDQAGWAKIDDLADYIRDALYADSTLGGEVPDVLVSAAATDGMQEWAGTDYFGLTLTVKLLA